MRKLAKAAVAAAVVASVGFISAGPATAQGAATMHRGGCIDILGEVGIANGLAGNLLNGEGNPGAQFTEC